MVMQPGEAVEALTSFALSRGLDLDGVRPDKHWADAVRAQAVGAVGRY